MTTIKTNQLASKNLLKNKKDSFYSPKENLEQMQGVFSKIK